MDRFLDLLFWLLLGGAVLFIAFFTIAMVLFLSNWRTVQRSFRDNYEERRRR